MLRFEKLKKGSVRVSLRAKEALISKPLLQAFGLAVLFHLVALLIFHIHSVHFTGSHTSYPPAKVDIDLSNTEVKIDAFPEESLLAQYNIPLPVPSAVQLPALKSSHFSTDLEIFEPLAEELFGTIHERILGWSPPMLAKKMPKLEMNATGNLNRLSLIAPELGEESVLAKGKEIVVFNVQVDGHTGQVFWQELESGGNARYIRAAEKMLGQIKFTGGSEVEKGTIEFIFASDYD